MTNELQIFNNELFGRIRLVEENGKVWACGSDVAKILGYSNTRDALSKHCKKEGVAFCDILTDGGKQKAKFIDEGNVYRLITHSKLPVAEKFERWVFDEVLPSIRKTGMYATDELLNNPDLAIQAFTALKAEREKNQQLNTTIKVQEQLIGELQPKANYVDIILNNKGLVTITQIAKDYGMSGREMNRLLHNYRVQYKQSGQWLLYSKYHDKGYTHSYTIDITLKDGTPDTRMETKWTQKGRLFIYELLKADGILPVIEQEDVKIA